MNRTTLLNWVLPIAILLGAAAPHSHAATLTGQVVKVADGDTVTVRNRGLLNRLPGLTVTQNGTRYRVRFLGIDAPEKNQAFGQDSRQNLDRLVYRKQVTVDYNGNDRYGRIVGKVLLDGKNINLEQIKSGSAWFYRHYAKDVAPADRKAYEAAEDAAKSAKLGLWKDASPTPPWDFRASERKATDTSGRHGRH
jgi:endonuclease YncB( thermonuclease family)